MEASSISAATAGWTDRLPTLPGERVHLRWLETADVPALFSIFSDPRVMRYWSSPPLPDVAAAGALLAEIHASFATRSLYQWGIERNGESGVIGTCTLFRLDAVHGRAEIGYALASAEWGRRLASDALDVLIRFAFETLGLHRLEGDVDPRNERSIALLLKKGFRREGVLRERYRVNGEIHDTVMLGLLRREWPPAGQSATAASVSCSSCS